MKHISPTAKILKSDVADGRHVGQYISGYNSFIHSFIQRKLAVLKRFEPTEEAGSSWQVAQPAQRCSSQAA